VSVASTGPYASLHLARADNHASTPPLSFLLAIIQVDLYDGCKMVVGCM